MRVVGGKMVGEDSNMRAGFVVFAAAEAMIFWIMLQGLMCLECKIQDEEHSWGW
jgi:heme/copper-type cytochrome/quinol oxidase subunit 3